MFSVLVRVPGRDFPAGGETLAAGLAVRQVVATHLPEGLVCRVKWPNDVWVDDRKLSGILVESRPDPAGGHALVIGVGLNLRTPPLPELPTTSLEALGATVCAPEVLLAECLASLEQRLPRVLSRGVATILDEFAAWDALADRQIEVELETGETWSGRGRGLDSEGHLMLETNGLKRAVRAGHVRLPARSGVRRAAPAPGANDS